MLEPFLGPRARPPVALPPIPLLRRERIVHLLDRAITHPVTLVTGRTGSGKTIAVAEWAKRGNLHGPLVWATLTGSDAAATALRAVLHRAADPAQQQPHVLVLDDVDAIEDNHLGTLLREILRHRPEQLRLVLVSRHEPPALQRLVLAGELGIVGPAELALTRDEAHQLLTLQGTPVAATALTHLMAATQGWAAAVRLAGMALAAERDTLDPHLFGGHHPLVIDYVLDELAHLPAAQQQVGLTACVVPDICARLSATLTDDHAAGRHLHALARDGFFLVRTAGDRFQMPPLVGQALHAHLLATDPRGHLDLHRRVAVWFEEQDGWHESMSHALQSQDWEFLGTLALRSIVPGFHTSERAGLATLVENIPSRVVHGRTELEIAYAHVMNFHGDRLSAESLLDRAEPLLGQLPPTRRAVATLALQALRADIAHGAGDARTMRTAVTAAQGTLDTLQRQDAPGWFDRPEVVSNLLARAHLWAGTPQQAIDILSTATTSPPVARRQLGLLALAQAGSGYPTLARATALAALDDQTGHDHDTQAPAAWLAQAIAAMLQADLPAADEAITFGSRLPAGTDPFISVAFHLVRAGHHFAMGDLTGARQALADFDSQSARLVGIDGLHAARAGVKMSIEIRAGADLRAGEPLDLINASGKARPVTAPPTIALVCQAYLLLVTGKPALVRDTVADLAERDDPLGAISWLLIALAEDALRRDALATESLARAIELCAPESLALLFSPVSGRLRTMLERHLEIVGTHPEFVQHILGLGTDEPAGTPAVAREPLTDRELSVVAYLPTLYSNAQIADSLGISVNTVKQHLKSIHRKLGVSTRRDALLAARRLNLLPDRAAHHPMSPMSPVQKGNSNGTRNTPTSP